MSACVGSQPEKLPAIEVIFSHYNVSGNHVVEIHEAKGVLVDKKDVRNIYEQPPYPGIHVYAYILGKNLRDVTPVTYVPLSKEGGSIKVYVGFRSPEEVPEKGDLLVVVVDVVEKKDGKFATVATDSKRITWNVSWEK
ncbi:hypothetical protein [Geoglobus ahangari]|uniref:hypothetical protein n=1 Tax=Geoglobus ahangari TaxID=113653 RepID=UPI0012ECB719|nr:hypothetical protein [Geoglobus ahangari]